MMEVKKLKSNVYGNYFGLRHYSGTTWTINRSKGWYLRWITQLNIHLLSIPYGNLYLSSNISEYGSPTFSSYNRNVGFNMGWIIEFIGKPVNGMQIYLKSAYTGLYIHSNRNGTYSTGSRNPNYNWILEWDGNLTSDTNFYIKSRGMGSYIGYNFYNRVLGIIILNGK